MTQGGLARAIGVERNTVSRWENGGVRPRDPAAIARAAAVLRVSIDWLIGAEAADPGESTTVEPLLSAPVAAAVRGYLARLVAAGCSAEQIAESERLLLASTRNRLRSSSARSRALQATLDDLEAAWRYVVTVLAGEGRSL
jgi:transcriptional regulator with XRE-family HTH domain